MSLLGAFCEEKLRPAIIWNTPSKNCVHRHLPEGLTLADLRIIANKDEDFLGTRIITFYRLGFEPYIDPKTLKPFHGGIPQEVNLTRHLEKVRSDIEREMPDPRYNGLAVIDYEAWRLHWARLFSNFHRYKERSRKYVLRHMKNLTKSHEVEFHAERLYNAAARRFITATFVFAKKLRPNAKWGLYKFPECYDDHHPNLTTCSAHQQRLNEELLWVVHLSDALYPSTYLFYDFNDPEKRFHAQIQEARRLAAKAGKPNLPVWKFTNLFTRGENDFLSLDELQFAFGTSFSPAGPDGIVIWGSSFPFRRRGFCANVTNYLVDTLGPYLRHAYLNECGSSPCLHGGACRDGLFSFECACVDGFAGKACEVVVDPCARRPCVGNSTCVVTAVGRGNRLSESKISPLSLSDFRCLCPQGVGGRLCDTALDPCLSSPCANGATCVAGDDAGDDAIAATDASFHCLCPTSFIGNICDRPNPCRSSPCLNRGVCVALENNNNNNNDGGAFRCDCDAHHSGVLCETSVRHCANSICHFRGTCILVNHSVACACLDRFTGAYCEAESHGSTDFGVGNGTKGTFSTEHVIWNCLSLAFVLVVFVTIVWVFKKIKSLIRRRFSSNERKNFGSSTFSDEDQFEVGEDETSGRGDRRSEVHALDKLRGTEEGRHPEATKGGGGGGGGGRKTESLRRSEVDETEGRSRFTYDRDHEFKEVFLDDKVTI